MLMVDEAHATGVFGENGRGLVESLALHERVHVRIGTLSKALGTGGGFVCGRKSLIDWLANRARTYVFSTAQPAATHAAGIAALEILRTEPWRRQQLMERTAEFRRRLKKQGWNTGSSASQIVPLIVGDPKETMRLAGRLRDAGYYVPGIRPPSVPHGESLIRISVCWHHTPKILDSLVNTLAAIR
jgi:8-amino-7-oxononanoate synthase